MISNCIIDGPESEPKGKAVLYKIKRMYLTVKTVQFLDFIANAVLNKLMDFDASESPIRFAWTGGK